MTETETRTINIYVGDLTTYLKQNKFQKFKEILPERLKFWATGPTQKKEEEEINPIARLIENSTLDEIPKYLESARKMMTEKGARETESIANRSIGRKMEMEVDDVGLRDINIKIPIVEKDGLKYQWSVRLDGLKNDKVVEIKTRTNRCCSTVYYPNELTQCQIYMMLTGLKYCEFIEIAKNRYFRDGKYSEKRVIIKQDKSAQKMIVLKTLEMIERIHPLVQKSIQLMNKKN